MDYIRNHFVWNSVAVFSGKITISFFFLIFLLSIIFFSSSFWYVSRNLFSLFEFCQQLVLLLKISPNWIFYYPVDNFMEVFFFFFFVYLKLSALLGLIAKINVKNTQSHANCSCLKMMEICLMSLKIHHKLEWGVNGRELWHNDAPTIVECFQDR